MGEWSADPSICFFHSLLASSGLQASNLWARAAAALWLTGCRALIIVCAHRNARVRACTHIYKHPLMWWASCHSRAFLSPMYDVPQTARHRPVPVRHRQSQSGAFHHGRRRGKHKGAFEEGKVGNEGRDWRIKNG